MALNSGTQLEGNPISAVILYGMFMYAIHLAVWLIFYLEGDDDLSTSMEECLYSDDEVFNPLKMLLYSY